MMITDPRFREVWDDVNEELNRRAEDPAEFLEVHENLDMYHEAVCAEADIEPIGAVVDAIIWDRDRRATEAREDREMAEELARDWDAYERRIAR